MDRPVLEAINELTRGCIRCCKHVTLNASGELECSLGESNYHPFPPPTPECPLPSFSKRLLNKTLDPETVTESFVEENRPHHDGYGKWK